MLNLLSTCPKGKPGSPTHRIWRQVYTLLNVVGVPVSEVCRAGSSELFHLSFIGSA
jgi:hypothetical protein